MLRIGTFSNVGTLERLCKSNNMVVGTTAHKNYLRHGCGVDKDFVKVLHQSTDEHQVSLFDDLRIPIIGPPSLC